MIPLAQHPLHRSQPPDPPRRGRGQCGQRPGRPRRQRTTRSPTEGRRKTTVQTPKMVVSIIKVDEAMLVPVAGDTYVWGSETWLRFISWKILKWMITSGTL